MSHRHPSKDAGGRGWGGNDAVSVSRVDLLSIDFFSWLFSTPTQVGAERVVFRRRASRRSPPPLCLSLSPLVTALEVIFTTPRMQMGDTRRLAKSAALNRRHEFRRRTHGPTPPPTASVNEECRQSAASIDSMPCPTRRFCIDGRSSLASTFGSIRFYGAHSLQLFVAINFKMPAVVNREKIVDFSFSVHFFPAPVERFMVMTRFCAGLSAFARKGGRALISFFFIADSFYYLSMRLTGSRGADGRYAFFSSSSPSSSSLLLSRF